MLSRREQLQLWLQRKKSGKKGSLVENKKVKERNQNRIVRRQSVSTTRRKPLGDATNRLVQKKKEQSKQNRRKSLCNISQHLRRSSSVDKNKQMKTLKKQTKTFGTQTGDAGRETRKRLRRSKRKVKTLKEKIRILMENFQMLGCERDVVILECADKERQWSEREKEYQQTIQTMKAKEEQFQKDTNAQIVQLKQQLITGLQASVSKVNDLKAELSKERALVNELRKGNQ